MRNLILFVFMIVGAYANAIELQVTPYNAWLTYSRKQCAFPHKLYPGTGDPVILGGESLDIQTRIEGGVQGEQRGISECEFISPYISSTAPGANSRICVLTDSVGQVIGSSMGPESLPFETLNESARNQCVNRNKHSRENCNKVDAACYYQL